MSRAIIICKLQSDYQSESLISLRWTHLNSIWVLPLTILQMFTFMQMISASMIPSTILTSYLGICLQVIKQLEVLEKSRYQRHYIRHSEEWISTYQGCAMVTNWLNQLFRNTVFPVMFSIITLMTTYGLFFFITQHNSSLLLPIIILLLLLVGLLIMYLFFKDITTVSEVTQNLLRQRKTNSECLRRSLTSKRLNSMNDIRLYCGNSGYLDKGAYIRIMYFSLDLLVNMLLHHKSTK